MKYAIAMNVVGFQACWLGFVASAANDRPWLGFVPLAIFATWQLAVTEHRRADLLIVAIAVAGGFVVDSLFAATGLLQYRAPTPSPSLAPVWILGMWAGFALTLNHSLAFLRSRVVAAALFGLVGGPLAYFVAASAWNAVAFGESRLAALLALAVAWGLATPLLVECAARLRQGRASLA